ncbi:MAG: Asp23/Gls24 family envelope stress response protein [Clostridia bacterium]|nr:Asp23/Gls24 family envelope stress response protein [Clostridia bacterium]
MNAVIENSYGKIEFSENALKQIVGTLVSESYGIVGVSAKGDGIAELLKRDNVAKGVKISVEDNKLNIELSVIVKYGVSIKTVAENIIDNVKFAVQEATSLEIDSLNVVVQGIRI